MKRDPIIGEWQTDKWGRRYRVVNTFGVPMQEYEMEVTTTAGDLPSSRIDEAEKAKQKRLEAIRSENEKPPKILNQRCPFNQVGKLCNVECAFYGPDGCFNTLDDPKGKRCPFNPYKCGEDCKLYKEGCELINFIKGEK